MNVGQRRNETSHRQSAGLAAPSNQSASLNAGTDSEVAIEYHDRLCCSGSKRRGKAREGEVVVVW